MVLTRVFKYSSADNGRSLAERALEAIAVVLEQCTAPVALSFVNLALVSVDHVFLWIRTRRHSVCV